MNELRSRLMIVALALVSGGVVGYVLQDRIATILLAPLKGEKLVYLTPTGGFDFIFKISLNTGILITIPVAIHQLYYFLAPLIKVRQTRRFAAFVIILSGTLAIVGVVFGYFVILPSAMGFLTGLANKYVEASLTASSYLDFVLVHSLGMAAIFQLPIILLFINLIKGPLKPSKLLKFEKYMVLGSIGLAALIAPPDLLSQTIVALPIFLTYQLGIVMVMVQNRMRAKKAPRTIEKDVEQKRFVQPETRTMSPIRRAAPPSPLARGTPTPPARRRQAYVGLDIVQSKPTKPAMHIAHAKRSPATARAPQSIRPIGRLQQVDTLSVMPRPRLTL